MAAEAPSRAPGAGEVGIDVEIAEVLFLDTQLRAGWGKDYFPLKPPFVPGTGVGGTVAAVGDGVAPELAGRRVVARTGDAGGYTTHAVVAAEEAFVVPDGLGVQAAIAALHDAPTALSSLDHAGIRRGERVLVTAAAGALGMWLVPLAKAAGAHVVGAARGEGKLAAVRQLGADLALDYSHDAWTAAAREATGGAGFDVVFDGAGGASGRAAFDATARNGRFFSYGAASGDFAPITPEQAAEREIAVTGIFDNPLSPEDWRRLTLRGLDELAAGRVTPIIGQTHPLERAADAHAAIEARSVIGKTLLTA
ncbi:zinc-binding dehydrogenase [Conexibacter woesei]|uniref:zinc-binding dehydrogenase n=1 Tax=Conexibacter woesei TaxID=191495 RepID=UPI0003191DBF|nr:zinc-binding dehydrogenase [Conexibacter woesei]